MVTDFTWEEFRGDTMKFDVAFTRGGSPLDISDFDIWFTGRLTKYDPDSVFERTLDNGGILLLNPAVGLARLIIGPADTETLEIPSPANTLTLECDMQIQEAGGDVETTARGTLALKIDITRTRNL